MVLTSLFFILTMIWFFVDLFAVQLMFNQKKKKSTAGQLMSTLFTFIWDILYDNVAIKEHAFLGYYYMLFMTVLFANISGMVPYSLTVTSYILITLFFALTTFSAINIVGYLHNGKNFFKVFLPGGIPLVISILLILIEVVSYVAKVLSLSIRLFANMMSGHTLLKILIAFVWGALSLSAVFAVAGGLAISMILMVTTLEACIAFLQAYVFIVLLSIYLNDVIHLH